MTTQRNPHRFRLEIVAFAVFGGLTGYRPALGEPVFMGLGDFPGGTSMSRANAVSADGSTVVGASRSATGREAFRWTFEEGMIGLGDLPGGDFESEARDVSADGSVIVGRSDSASGSYGEAFRWEGGVMTGLGDLSGGSFSSEARAVSADGSFIVGSGISEAGTEAFLWNAATGMVGLGDLPGGQFQSQARGVSDDASVVVGTGQTGIGEVAAFRWTESTGMVGLGYLPGPGGLSSATGVSSDGSVVFGYSDSDEGTQAFRWSAETGMEALGSFGPLAMSEDGTVMVGSISSSQAVIWDEVNGIRDLEDLLEVDFGLDLSDWTLLSARDISADGTVIVGLGINPQGYKEGWVAVIPEPSCLTLFILCAWALPKGSRQKAFRCRHKRSLKEVMS
ncbi:MAG: PEP-CTERM sorting domain-containing protein [Phycisphaerae bacterium]